MVNLAFYAKDLPVHVYVMLLTVDARCLSNGVPDYSGLQNVFKRVPVVAGYGIKIGIVNKGNLALCQQNCFHAD